MSILTLPWIGFQIVGQEARVDPSLTVVEVEICHPELDKSPFVGLLCALKLWIVDWKGCHSNYCPRHPCPKHQENGG